jgi:hypothetical protein
MHRLSLFIVLLLLSLLSFGQTYSGQTGLFSANDTTVFELNLSGLNPQNINSSFGLEQIQISLSCQNTGDLIISLTAPDNTETILTNRSTSGNYFTNTVFKDNAYYFINEGWDTFTGEFRPDDNIGYANNNQNANGIWKLKIINTGWNQGSLTAWQIIFSNTPSLPVNFQSSNLPIISLETNGATIPDEPKINALMTIIDNGQGNTNQLNDVPVFSGNIGVELRGSSSQSFLKKSYGIITYDQTGADLNVSLFGMPEESDWALIANYSDKSLFRNALSYELARQTGRYASRTKFVELFINGKYRGVYQFCEKIKRDPGRVDIAKLNTWDITGDELTGGYILKIDKTTGGDEGGFPSPFPPPNNNYGQYTYFQYEYPDGDVIQPEQEAYIEAFMVDTFETVLNSDNFDDPVNGFGKFANESSFMDFFFINELSKNIDGYRISTFIHKDKSSNGGKLNAGPVWDFDLAWRNADYYGGYTADGWVCEFPYDWDWYQPPFWWVRLFSNVPYCNNLNNRWCTFRQTIFSQSNIFSLIDSYAAELNDAQARNFQKWNILGRYVWPNPAPLAQSYNEEIENMKEWITDRLQWMDQELSTYATNIDNIQPDNFSVYPNPCSGKEFHIFLKPGSPTISEISITDINGNVLINETLTKQSGLIKIPVFGLSKGIYLITLRTDHSLVSQKLILL